MPPPALPQEPCLTAEMLLPFVELTYQPGLKGTVWGPANSRLREVSLEYGLDRQVTSLWMLAEVLLGPELVLQRCSEVSHVLTGCGLQRHKQLQRCCLMKSRVLQVSILRKEVPSGWAQVTWWKGQTQLRKPGGYMASLSACHGAWHKPSWESVDAIHPAHHERQNSRDTDSRGHAEGIKSI